MKEKVKVGLVGCGDVLPQYVNGIRKFDVLEILACSSRDPERARAKAREFGIPKACRTEEMLADPEIQIVVNLTPPVVHAEITLAAIAAGKHVYNEKPLAINRDEGKRIIEAAEHNGVAIGCAPDTFLGAGLQTCRKLVDDGWIGEPIGATAFWLSRGPASWHPKAELFYQPGAGPLFDMGPYYLTALIHLLGPIKRVTGFSKISFPERVLGHATRRGETFKVNTPTHVTSLLEFSSGVMATIIMSFEVWSHDLPPIEIYGSDGTLNVPQPGYFGGPVKIKIKDAENWCEMPLTHPCVDNCRGLGIADMVYALRAGRMPRANGALAFHVLDVMQTILESSEAHNAIEISSACERPAALPLGLAEGELDGTLGVWPGSPFS